MLAKKTKINVAAVPAWTVPRRRRSAGLEGRTTGNGWEEQTRQTFTSRFQKTFFPPDTSYAGWTKQAEGNVPLSLIKKYETNEPNNGDGKELKFLDAIAQYRQTLFYELL